MHVSKYKLLIFDFDGTIFATHEAIVHCINKTFDKYKKRSPSRDAIYKTITMGIGLDETFKILNKEVVTNDVEGTSNQIDYNSILSQSWVETYRHFYKSEGQEKAYLFDQAKEVFSDIYLSGKTIIIISNKGTDAINSALDKHDLKQFIALVVGDTVGIKKKPDPMIFDEIIKPTFKEINPSEILVVGDTSADLLFAKNIGADSCWATYGYGLPEECKKINPTYIISNLIDINRIV